VVEFGNSLYQKSVDRYIAGDDVPFEQVQKAWRNMIGTVGPVSPVYGWFYKAVRESNLQRRGGHQIRLQLHARGSALGILWRNHADCWSVSDRLEQHSATGSIRTCTLNRGTRPVRITSSGPIFVISV
jgi:hypothetical protein